MHIAVSRCDRYGSIIVAANVKAAAGSRADFYITCRFWRIRFPVLLTRIIYYFDKDWKYEYTNDRNYYFYGGDNVFFMLCKGK